MQKTSLRESGPTNACNCMIPLSATVASPPHLSRRLSGMQLKSPVITVNIVKCKMPQITDKCLVFGMFARHINIDKLKDLVVVLNFGRENTAVHVDILAKDFY